MCQIEIPFLFVSIHLLCLYILYLKYCLECTVSDTITYNGTLIKTRHFYYLHHNRMIVVWNTMNSGLLQNTSIKQQLDFKQVTKGQIYMPINYYRYLNFISLFVILLSNFRVDRLSCLSRKTFQTVRVKLLSVYPCLFLQSLSI